MFTGQRCSLLHLTNDDDEHSMLANLTGSGNALVLTRVRTGDEALHHLRSAKPSERPNLVLVSWVLAGMSAEDFLLQLKSDPAIRAVPAIVFTPPLPRTGFQRIYSLGASCVIETTRDPEADSNNVRLLFSFWTNVARLPYCEPPKQDNFD